MDRPELKPPSVALAALPGAGSGSLEQGLISVARQISPALPDLLRLCLERFRVRRSFKAAVPVDRAVESAPAGSGQVTA